MAFDDFGDGSIWDNEDLVQESAVFRILTESKADGAPLTLEALCAADDIIQEVKSLNTELVQFLSAEEVATKLVDYIVTPRPPSRQEEAFRVPYIASEIIACAAPGVVRAVMSAPSADRPGVTALQRLLLFADRRSPLRTYLSAYAARAIEALAQAEPLQVARAALATPGVVDACVRHSDDPACTKVLSLLARLPFTAADPMFSGSGKVHPDDAASLAASIAACLHPAGRKLPRGRTGGGPSGAAVRSDPPALSAGEGGPSSDSAAEADLIPAPGLAAAAESASANAAELVLAALQLARVRPGAGVFLLRDAVRGVGGAGGAEGAAAAASSPSAAAGVARAKAIAAQVSALAGTAAGLSKGKVAASEARLAATVAVHPSAVDSRVSPGDSVHLLLAKDFGATAEAAARCLAELLLAPWEDVQLAVVEAGGVKALLDASEAFPWHSLLHSTVGDALQEALEEGALPATARHIVVDCELVRWVGRTLAITGHPSTLAKVGAPSPPAARSAPVAALGLRLANTLEAELARADAPASRGAGGEGPGRLPAPVRRHLEASDEWCRIACGPLAVANIVAAEQAAGAAPSANDLSVSRDSHGIHGLGPSVDEIDGKMPDGA
ncbi:hypothetical protein FNF28_07329 [Cafeteria roenbergensis]|uniref:Uncharacterized protein n=1 Tax=Cafeteria roenbergensis TaxID=33653 RepID=A0A5A8CA51_CAFRO|nr:hypothetical protein FNF28_07329 [Cafeteria roenbergensis]